MCYFHMTKQCIGYDDRMLHNGGLHHGCLDAHIRVCIRWMRRGTHECYMTHLGMHTPMVHDTCLHAHSNCIRTLQCTRAFAYLGTHTQLPPYIKILPDSVHVGANSIFVARQVNGCVSRGASCLTSHHVSPHIMCAASLHFSRTMLDDARLQAASLILPTLHLEPPSLILPHIPLLHASNLRASNL